MLSFFKDLFTFNGLDMGYSAEYQRAYAKETENLEYLKRRYNHHIDTFYKMLEETYNITKEEAGLILMCCENQPDFDFEQLKPSREFVRGVSLYMLAKDEALREYERQQIIDNGFSFNTSIWLIAKSMIATSTTTKAAIHYITGEEKKRLKVTYEIIEPDTDDKTMPLHHYDEKTMPLHLHHYPVSNKESEEQK